MVLTCPFACQTKTERLDMKITLGPFLYQTTETIPTSAPVSPLHITMEWASAEHACQIPLFRVSPTPSRKLRLQHLVVRVADLPCDVVCTEPHIVVAQDQTYVPFEAVIAALYRSEEVARPIRDVLGELAQLVLIEAEPQDDLPNHGLLIPAAESEGFRVAHAVKDGDEMLLGICWQPRSSSSRFHVLNGVFRLSPELSGEWIEPPPDVGVACQLASELHRLFPTSPCQLLSAGGHQLIATLT